MRQGDSVGIENGLTISYGERFTPGNARERLAAALTTHHDEIARAWLEVAESETGRFDLDLEDRLGSLISGLANVLESDDWALTQGVIDELAELRARSRGGGDVGFQRALVAGRRAMNDFISFEDHDLLLETLHECVIRYYESYQGVRVATEGERMNARIIRSLVMALEARDPYTKGHSLSVALLCDKIARVIGGVDPQHAYLAGLLHDVGKVGIPDGILLKGDALTDEEWVIMRAHPVMGANILAPIKLYSPIVDGVISHHENWNGSGYPTGRAEYEIPVLGRMIRTADSFDAMTTTRAFRSGKGITETVLELDAMAGLIYDPEMVLALKKVVEEPITMRELSMASLEIELTRRY